MALRTTIAALLAGLLALGLAGCGGGAGEGLATVIGRVVDDGSMQPVAGALVRVGDTARDTTAGDGSFTIVDTPTGSQTLTVAANGHETYQEGVTLTGGTNALGTLYVPPTLIAGRGGLTGTMVLSNGTPVGGGIVETAGASAVSRDDGTGRFTLYNVPPSTVQVNFSDPATGQNEWRYITFQAGRILSIGQVRLAVGPPPPP